MSASASFQIDPGTSVYGAANTAQDAAVSVTCNCRLVSTSGVSSVTWEIFGTHGIAAPTITLSGNPTGQIASFDTNANPGQSYGIRCKVNGGSGVTGDSATTQTSAVYVLDAIGNRPFFLGETFEGDSTYGVVVRMNTALRLFSLAHTDVSASPYNVLTSDVVLAVNTGLGAYTINLPAVASNTGRVLWVKDGKDNAAANNITIDGNGAEKIDQAATRVLNVDSECAMLYCDGTQWQDLNRS